MDQTFDLPEGTFKARLSSVSPKQRFHGTDQINQTRLLFEVDVPGIKFKRPMAGKSFDINLRKGSELRWFLEAWKGAEWLEQNAGQKIDLDQFIGEEVELELTHLIRPPHKRPLVLITKIRPIQQPIKLQEVKQAA